MKQSRGTTPRGTPSRRTPSRRTTPPRTTSGRTQRDAQETPEYYVASSEDRLGATPDAPLSLQSGAGRQYCDEVLRLLVQIRADCDAAAERLGYGSDKDDGLAAVEYIGNKILQAVAGERQQQIARAKTKPAASPSEGPNQSFADPKTRHKPQARIERTSNSERSTLVGELKQMLRDGETKAGVVIDPPLAHEIAKHITILNEELAQPQTAQSMTRIRDSVARFFGKVSGDRKTPKKSAKAAVAALAERPKPAKTEPSRPKKPKTTVTKRSVTNRAVFKPSASKGAKGSKGSKRR